MLPDHVGWTRGRTDHLRRRGRRRRGHVDGVAGLFPPRPGRGGTRVRILAVAAELGYRPNPHARALLSGRHHTVAMVVSDITNPHFFELIRGAELRARARSTRWSWSTPRSRRASSATRSSDSSARSTGSCWPRAGCPTRICEQIAAQRPVVLMSRELPGLASVVLDHVEGCRQIVGHLASLGHRELVYWPDPPNSWMAGTRWGALNGAAEQAGITARRIGPFTPKVSQGGAAADAAVNAGTTAVVAHNDLLGDRRDPATRAARAARPRRRERRRVRRHLRRRPLHAPAHHPGRGSRRSRPSGGRALAHRGDPRA